MKKLLFLLVPVMFFFACNTAETKETEGECCDKEKTECCDKEKDKMCENAISVDELMENIADKADQEVIICGACTHICDHSGKNIFINSNEDEEIVIVGKAAEGVEAFDKALEGNQVMVKGKVIAVEVEAEDEIEVHHEVELNYYIEVTEVKKCCDGGEHKCKGEKKDHKCKGEHKKEHNCDGKHHEE